MTNESFVPFPVVVSWSRLSHSIKQKNKCQSLFYCFFSKSFNFIKICLKLEIFADLLQSGVSVSNCISNETKAVIYNITENTRCCGKTWRYHLNSSTTEPHCSTDEQNTFLICHATPTVAVLNTVIKLMVCCSGIVSITQKMKDLTLRVESKSLLWILSLTWESGEVLDLFHLNSFQGHSASEFCTLQRGVCEIYSRTLSWVWWNVSPPPLLSGGDWEWQLCGGRAGIVLSAILCLDGLQQVLPSVGCGVTHWCCFGKRGCFAARWQLLAETVMALCFLQELQHQLPLLPR